MSETEKEPVPETEKEPVPETEPPFKITSIDDMKRVLTIAQGGDPDAIQAITKFMDFNSNVERSYFPDKTITLCVGQLNGYGKVYFKDDPDDPFSLVANAIIIPFMGYKGFKSNQFVDMTRQTPNLDALTSSPDEVKQDFVSKLLGRGKTE